MVKGNGNVGVGEGNPTQRLEVFGGPIGQRQAGSFQSLANGNQWIATGLSPVSITGTPGTNLTNPYGTRIQADSDFALFQLVNRSSAAAETLNGERDAEIAWGDDRDDNLNVVFIDGAGTRTRIAQFSVTGFSVPRGTDALASGQTGGSGQTEGTGLLTINGEISSDALELRNGSDIAEPFDIAHTQPIVPGMVVSIDPETPGALRVATSAYDRTVAGIVSGAGGIRPALTLRQEGTITDGEHPVALTGRVYVYVDANYGAVAPGDLLTTSDTPGHAMRATDSGRTSGAVLGKAMTALDQGQGLVLVLVSLQ